MGTMTDVSVRNICGIVGPKIDQSFFFLLKVVEV